MWIYLQSPTTRKGKELGFNRIQPHYDIFSPPWLWGWQEVIAETKTYWILEKSKERYVFVFKKTLKAHCLYSGNIIYYGNAMEFSATDPNEYNIIEDIHDSREALEELLLQIEKLKKKSVKCICRHYIEWDINR